MLRYPVDRGVKSCFEKNAFKFWNAKMKWIFLFYFFIFSKYWENMSNEFSNVTPFEKILENR